MRPTPPEEETWLSKRWLVVLGLGGTLVAFNGSPRFQMHRGFDRSTLRLIEQSPTRLGG